MVAQVPEPGSPKSHSQVAPSMSEGCATPGGPDRGPGEGAGGTDLEPSGPRRRGVDAGRGDGTGAGVDGPGHNLVGRPADLGLEGDGLGPGQRRARRRDTDGDLPAVVAAADATALHPTASSSAIVEMGYRLDLKAHPLAIRVRPR